MKKIISLAFAALAFALVTGCMAYEGEVYLAFDWTYTPEWFSTDDPSLPDTIYRNAEYLTEEGRYYFEYYHAESECTRWIWYTLTANDGIFPYVPAEDARFELFLHAYSDPAFIRWESVSGDAPEQPDSIPAAQSPVRPEDELVQTWQDQVTSGSWTLEIRGGVVEQ